MVTIPNPVESDVEDVTTALEVAHHQITRGDPQEALKWLRRAIDAAFEAGDDRRGMDLSRAAAEFKTAFDLGMSEPPPPVASFPEVKTPVAPMPVQTPSPRARSREMPKPGATLERAPVTRPPSMGVGRATSPPQVSPPPQRSASRAMPAVSQPMPAVSQPMPAVSQPMPAVSQPMPAVSQPMPAVSPAVPPVASRLGADEQDSELLETFATDLLERNDPLEDFPKEEPTREYVLQDLSDEMKAVGGDMLVRPQPPPPEASAEPSIEEANLGSLPPQSGPPTALTSDAPPAVGGNKSTRPKTYPVPYTRAIRVAVKRTPGGTVAVRLLDRKGLREGEQDCLLVALTAEPDLRNMFRPSK